MAEPSVSVAHVEQPHAVRRFLDGSYRGEVLVGTVVVGRGVYRPGWRWSEHTGPQTGKPSQPHAGYVVSGRLSVRGADGTEAAANPGDAFFADAGHDAWVEGDEPCVALDFPVPPIS
jgi:quercetin dioxygenase-like cupin family protein